jgi:hypothetical protein
MIGVGAHYLPFIFFYGLWEFGVLAAILIGAGLACARYFPSPFAIGGWFTALVLLFLRSSVGRCREQMISAYDCYPRRSSAADMRHVC